MSAEWEQITTNGDIVGVDRNGDHYTRSASRHEKYYMPLRGEDGSSRADKDKTSPNGRSE